MNLSSFFKKVVSVKIRRKILSFLNLSLAIYPDPNTKVIIPIINGIGSLNLHYQQDWMFFLLSNLIHIKSGNFLDIGVNLGQTLIAFKTTNSTEKYIGFEPNSICINYLLKLISVNKFKNCLIAPVGLFNNNQLTKLYFPEDSTIAPDATIFKDFRPDRDLISSIVAVFRLDDILDTLEIEKISIIKIDVEGAELEVLEGMMETIKQYRPFIVCEVLFGHSQVNPEIKENRDSRLFNYLINLNYLVFQIIKTPDLKEVQNFYRLDSFPQLIWEESNKDLCDYLFIPAEDETTITSRLGQ